MTISGRGGGGSGLPIAFTLSGPGDQIQIAADKLAAYIRSIPGTVNVQTNAGDAAPHLTVRIDPQRAAVLGVSPGAAALVARTAVGGVVATKVRTWNGLVNVLLEILSAKSSQLAAGRRQKNLSLAEDYFANHFPGYPVMPGSLIH